MPVNLQTRVIDLRRNLLALGARGVHPNDVSLRGGHANAVVTMKVYCLPTALSD